MNSAELRETIARHEKIGVQHIKMRVLHLESVAAALERMEALEKYSRNLLAVSRAVGVLGATEVSEAEESLDRLLATPAPAGQQGGSDD